MLENPDSDHIEVRVISEYVPGQSNSDANRYVFAYHVSIENRGTIPAQLLSRHWIITDGNQKVQEVKGEGVIGEQTHHHARRNLSIQQRHRAANPRWQHAGLLQHDRRHRCRV